MKKPLIIALSLCTLSLGLHAAKPILKFQEITPRMRNPGILDIEYDMLDSDGDKVFIWTEASDDNGSTWRFPSQDIKGSIGANITSEYGLTMRWDAFNTFGDALFENIILRIRADDTPVPEGMMPVPPGIFLMGDALDETNEAARPVHYVYTDAFYMKTTEVTLAEWEKVYEWAIANGYDFMMPGFSDGPDFPVHSISWYDMIKWCNAKSEMEEREPAYYTNNQQNEVYRQGQLDLSSDAVKWDANGYRLPTEAEWEKAARGNTTQTHFPGGGRNDDYESVIISSYAAFYNPTNTVHSFLHKAGYYDGDQLPKGPDMANGFGLYDMSGNVFEMCWDWRDTEWYSNPSASEDNPRGPDTGETRVIRGGSYATVSKFLRCAHRVGSSPANINESLGFRYVLAYPMDEPSRGTSPKFTIDTRPQSQSNFFEDTTWFGGFDITNYPVMWSWELGWIFAASEDPQGILLYPYGLGTDWIWTAEGTYPWVWSWTLNGWFYYYEGTGNTNGGWFNDLNQGQTVWLGN